MSENQICPTCGIFLREPYIRCAVCKDPPLSFCLSCFAKGKEYDNHRNNHAYIIYRNNFSLFDSDWMASEEIKLLDAISECGFGNWEDVAKYVGSKSKTECEEHYFKHYIYKPKPPLPVIPEPEIISQVHSTPVACTTFSQDPPRPIVGSTMYQEMAGYMPARGEFSTEYDDYAEMDIKDLDFSDLNDMMRNALQLATLRIYQSRLKERARRKWIVREYGLISMKRTHEDAKRYSILATRKQEKMRTLMHFFKAEAYVKFMEGILWEEKTKQRIQLLKECRKTGITRLHSIGTYLRLRKKREDRQKTRTALDEVLAQIKDEASCYQYFRKQAMKENSQGLPDVVQSVGRKAAPPINIAGMPGYESLSKKERELCASLRLLPTSFLNYKSVLVNECRKLGSLRLANARSVIKIDVNKTRKIYDLLLEEGFITKSS